MSVDLESVRVFARVVEAGSFTRAAAQLGVPKSSVSRRLSALEETLGARLLNRSTRTLSLTDLGEVFYARAARALEELQDAARAVEQLQAQPRGELRLTAPVDIGSYLTAVIADFMRTYPEVQVVLFATGRRVDLVAEGFDLAVRAGALPDSSLVARKLTDSHLGLYASRDYLDAHGTPSTIAELSKHAWLLFGLERLRTTLVLHGPTGVAELDVRGQFATNDFSVLRTAAEHHLGIAVLPTFSAKYQDLGGLLRVLPEYRLPGGGIYVVYPSHRHLSPKVRVFIDFLGTRLQQDWVGSDR